MMRGDNTKPRRRAALGLAVLAATAPAAATPPDYGLDFVTIGHAGNRLPTEAEAPLGAPYGRVDYEYRIMRTPVTVGMWWEFVQAYAPYTDDRSQAFTGNWIWRDFDGVLYPPADIAINYPTDAAFRYAARFVNWLHNGKRSDQAAFENGVYDTSTFGDSPDGGYSDNRVPAQGSRYWIPTIDEWVKANHFDPDRYGEGKPGYWRYPQSSDSPPIPGLPGTGAETDAGLDQTDPLAVGSYPNAASPFGLLDASGGLREFTTSTYGPTGSNMIPDTAAGDPEWWYFDRIEANGTWGPGAPFVGFRIASNVPSVSATGVFMMSILITPNRRRPQ